MNKYTTNEVEAMKRRITEHCDADGCAWFLRIILEGDATFGANEQAQRELELYEMLTENNLPKWT